MPKLTLLELVQDALDATDAEEVSDVEETTDSSMIVNIANRSYEEMMAKHKWRHLRKYAVLEGSTNLNDLDLPAGTVSFDPFNMWYGIDGNELRVTYLDPDMYLQNTIGRLTSESNITKIDNLKVYNDRPPLWFTSDNDETLRFDAMPTSAGLVAGNSLCLIWQLPANRLLVNADIFDLPETAFPALSSLIITKALNELKGDTQGAALERRNYITLMSSLARNARVVDKPDDNRKFIVPRKTNPNRHPRIAQ